MRRFALAPFAFTLLALALPAAAHDVFYIGTLTGAKEAQPNASPGMGTAMITINDHDNTMRVQFSFSGLAGNLTAAHIHCCTVTAEAGTAGVATPTPTFTVSGTLTSPVNERSPHQRVSLPYRLLSPDMILFAAYAIYASIPLISRILIPYCFPTGSLWTSRSTSFPFPGLMVRCAKLTWAVSSPVRYMIWPPDKIEWERLLVEGKDGVLRPRREWRGLGRQGGQDCEQIKAKAAVDVSWTLVTLFELFIGWMCL